MEFCSSYSFKPGQGPSTQMTDDTTNYATNQEATVTVQSLNLSPAVLAAYRKKFETFDLNKDGLITRREFMAVSKVFGYHLTNEELVEIFGKTDTDDSGGITFDEFVIAMVKRSRKAKDLEPVKQKLKIYDKRNRGYITSDEAFPVLKKLLGFDLNKTDALVDMYDKNKDYKLTLLEFKEFQARVEELEAQVDAGFMQFDTNRDGKVDLAELKAAMTPKGFTDHQVLALMDKYDSDRDGCLNREEFAAFFDVPIM